MRYGSAWFLVALVALSAGCDERASHAPAADAAPSRADAAAPHDAGVASVDALPQLTTRALAPLQGRLSTPAPGQSDIGYNSTDLGYVIRHGGTLRVLFGDACADDMCTPIDPFNDDVQGEISADDFPDGDAVDAYVSAHPAPSGAPAWQAAAPPVTMRVGEDGKVAPIKLFRDGEPINAGVFRAPTSAFSNGRDGMFATFERSELTQCTGGEAPTCVEGLTCDTGLGACIGPTGEPTLACELGSMLCCQPVAGGGLCRDPTSPFYKDTSDSRILSVAHRAEVGNADLDAHEVYYVRSWNTHKFINLAARTVDDFDPTRAHGEGNDYRTADGDGDTEREKVFIWGRPNFAGTAATDQDAKLYFAYVDMPEYDPAGRIAWEPHYFVALTDAGESQFSTSQADAAPLDLSGAPDPTAERYDIVNPMSISFVPALGQWVMLYGGDLQGLALLYFLNTAAVRVQHDPEGAIHVRFARQPWGPWSAPEQVVRAGDPMVTPPLPGTEYGPGGILFHPGCTGLCAPPEPGATAENGFLYGANIVEPWTTEHGNQVDLYWNVSTWNPYMVVLMRTRIEH